MGQVITAGNEAGDDQVPRSGPPYGSLETIQPLLAQPVVSLALALD